MELKITKFFTETCPRDYQASVAEIGELSSLLLARLPQLIADFKGDMLAIGFEWKETV